MELDKLWQEINDSEENNKIFTLPSQEKISISEQHLKFFKKKIQIYIITIAVVILFLLVTAIFYKEDTAFFGYSIFLALVAIATSANSIRTFLTLRKQKIDLSQNVKKTIEDLIHLMKKYSNLERMFSIIFAPFSLLMGFFYPIFWVGAPLNSYFNMKTLLISVVGLIFFLVAYMYIIYFHKKPFTDEINDLQKIVKNLEQ